MTIGLEAVGISIASRTVIEPITRHVDGRSLLIIGGVGAGKTLFARSIAGDRLDTEEALFVGSISLGKDRIDLGSPSKGLARIGYMPQIATSFFIAPSVEDEIGSTAYCAASSASHAEEILNRWRRASPLIERASLPPLSLSGGQQRMLMLEAVLASNPDHLVMDGADVAFDAEFRSRSRSLISGWLEESQNRTLISFSNSVENQWLRFDAHLELAPKSEPHRASRYAPLRPAVEMLRFERISGGPPTSSGPLLRDLSLTLRTGEFVALTGANGIGKSTLISLVAGIERPVSGEIYFGGRPLAEVDWPGLEGGILFLPQEPELAGLGDLFGANRSPREMPRDFSTSANSIVWDGTTAGYWTLSSGERALLTLIKQATLGPAIWILDEPTSRIPPDILAEIIREYRERQPALAGLIVSHDDSFTDSVCERRLELTADGLRESTPALRAI